MNLSAAMLSDITSFNLPTRVPGETASEAKARKLACGLAISDAALIPLADHNSDADSNLALAELQ